MIKVFHSLDFINKEKWDVKDMSIFLNLDFLECFYSYHNDFKHIFIISRHSRLYGQIFQLRIDKTANYFKYRLILLIMNIFRINVLYFSNSFFTNTPSFYFNKPQNIENIISKINQSYFMIVIPDIMMESISNESKDGYERIEVEEDMILSVRKEWNILEDYINDLKTKYRGKIKQILHRSKILKVRKLNEKEVTKYKYDIQKLFDQVVENAKFRGPSFNTDIMTSLVKKKFLLLYGYFIDNKLIAFSSEIYHKDTLYSYYVGFEKNKNKRYSLYGRILVETIEHAILCKKKRIVFGRTANEFKSNFGAKPIKSYIHVKFRNTFVHKLLKLFITRMKLPSWKQRNPFKNK